MAQPSLTAAPVQLSPGQGIASTAGSLYKTLLLAIFKHGLSTVSRLVHNTLQKFMDAAKVVVHLAYRQHGKLLFPVKVLGLVVHHLLSNRVVKVLTAAVLSVVCIRVCCRTEVQEQQALQASISTSLSLFFGFVRLDTSANLRLGRPKTDVLQASGPPSSSGSATAQQQQPACGARDQIVEFLQSQHVLPSEQVFALYSPAKEELVQSEAAISTGTDPNEGQAPSDAAANTPSAAEECHSPLSTAASTAGPDTPGWESCPQPAAAAQSPEASSLGDLTIVQPQQRLPEILPVEDSDQPPVPQNTYAAANVQYPSHLALSYKARMAAFMSTYQGSSPTNSKVASTDLSLHDVVLPAAEAFCALPNQPLPWAGSISPVKLALSAGRSKLPGGVH